MDRSQGVRACLGLVLMVPRCTSLARAPQGTMSQDAPVPRGTRFLVADAPRGTLDLTTARALLRTKPKDGRAHAQMAFALYKHGDYRGAVDQFRTALGIDREHPMVRLYLGEALRAARMPRDAIQVYSVLVREPTLTHKQRSQVYQGLASAQWDLGRYDDAAASLRASIRCDPRNGNASFGLGALEAYYHRSGRARDLFLAAARDADSKHALAKACAALGRLYEETGNATEAADMYRKALRADERNPWARSGLTRLRPDH